MKKKFSDPRQFLSVSLEILKENVYLKVKMNFLLLKFFILTIFIGESVNILLECQYGKARYGYICDAQNPISITSKNDREISKVKGEHKREKNDNDVTVFTSFGNTINFFPRCLTKFFKNINYIRISNANLTEISKEDLKDFNENLKTLKLSYNQIEAIDGDLFEYNPNLGEIDFNMNKIVQIDTRAFSGIKNIKLLELSANPCTKELDSLSDDPSGVIFEVKYLCKNLNQIATTEFYEITSNIDSTTNKPKNSSTTSTKSCLIIITIIIFLSLIFK